MIAELARMLPCTKPGCGCPVVRAGFFDMAFEGLPACYEAAAWDAVKRDICRGRGLCGKCHRDAQMQYERMRMEEADRAEQWEEDTEQWPDDDACDITVGYCICGRRCYRGFIP